MHRRTVVDFKGLGKRLVFKDPLCELIADRPEDVVAVLDSVESYQRQGCYVVGYVSYEASRAFVPDVCVHTRRLAGEHLAYFTVHAAAEVTAFPLSYEAVEMPASWTAQTDQATYARAIEEIHRQIRAGDTYQVNYTVQLTAEVSADSLSVYNRLVVEQGADYNIYVAHDDFAVVSASPELFFEKRGNVLRTRPMKGTTHRGANLAEDVRLRDWLAQDRKNRAENLMIVDLLRNDMGCISETGSVAVVRACQVERYSTVWQMTSTIESRLKEGTGLATLFGALFPCGSITGAPKRSTMSIIRALEPEPRGVYCGAAGICLPGGDCVFNVAIRTLQIQGRTAVYGVGGGITWDSRWQDEYEEVRQKSAVLYRRQPSFDLITTGKVSAGCLTFLEEHLIRLEESSAYFAYPFDKARARTDVRTAVAGLAKDKEWRLRIRLERSGRIVCESFELKPLPASYLNAFLVERTEKTDGPFASFKTTHRPHIPPADGERIFISPDGFLQETSIANLIVDLDGVWLTPPLAVGILDGICRRQLIASGRVKEAWLTKADLMRARAVYACNAVRGVYPLKVVSTVAPTTSAVGR